jgi:flavin-dependent dehydrogenase
VLVGPDGANSAVVRSLGLRSGFDYGLGINGDIPVNGNKLKEWEGLLGLDWGISGGYAWVFPKKGYLAVGAGSSYRAARSLKSLRFTSTQFIIWERWKVSDKVTDASTRCNSLSLKRILLVVMLRE